MMYLCAKKVERLCRLSKNDKKNEMKFIIRRKIIKHCFLNNLKYTKSKLKINNFIIEQSDTVWQTSRKLALKIVLDIYVPSICEIYPFCVRFSHLQSYLASFVILGVRTMGSLLIIVIRLSRFKEYSNIFTFLGFADTGKHHLTSNHRFLQPEKEHLYIYICKLIFIYDWCCCLRSLKEGGALLVAQMLFYERVFITSQRPGIFYWLQFFLGISFYYNKNQHISC